MLNRRAAITPEYQIVGEQIHIDDLGGANFDDAVLRQVIATGADLGAIPLDLAQLRGDVVKAKVTLSFEADATVPVQLASGNASVRINRSEFESLIDADLAKTLDALELAIESAGVAAERLEAIVLTGGSARIPLVAQRLSERFDLPIFADPDTNGTAALGAAQIALERLQEGALVHAPALVSLKSSVVGTELVPAGEQSTSAASTELVPAPARAGPLTISRPATRKSWWPKSPILLSVAAALIAFAIIFSNTTAAGSRWPDYVQEIADAAVRIVSPFRAMEAAEAVAVQPAAPVVPPASAPPSTNNERNVTRDEPSTPVNRTRKIAEPDAPSTSTPPREGVEPAASGPRVEPSSPPDAEPPQTIPPADTTPPVETLPADAAPPAETPPADTPPPTDTPPADTTPPAETTPPTDTTPPAETPPADTTPPVDTTPPAELPPGGYSARSSRARATGRHSPRTTWPCGRAGLT
ncbi:hypothetical protein DC31_08080 [Microbacterium sp. CH12i]|uniref:Hsp70 family protein n=1 Tax=Microbacterium sp. CH12i TaxID=1479651 RepID=UPI0004617A0D|nr:Hsp70 family protein [Microbacterium sp. CH12i]KDA06407.1 hypothetical protein DC31_08080 [Microbacterium sp. CH12i]